MTGPGGLLDIAPVGAAEYAGIEDRCRAVLDTEQTLFIFQGEATVALEAVARGLGRPGCRALNLVSGPYGATFGRWLAESGARVDTLEVPFDRAVTPDLLASALDRVGRVDVVSLVHAEAATGVVNDLAAIAQMAKSIGALVVVDAVASVGAEPLDMDAWGLDLVVLSAQKALAGPSGASIVVTSPGAWEALGRHPSPWRRSVLSLLDWRDLWVFTDRLTLPGIPNHLETRALGAAADRVAHKGLRAVVARHQAAAAAARAGLGPLGLRPWVQDDRQSAAVVTVVRATQDGPQVLVTAATESSGGSSAALAVAPGPLAKEALRVNHTGRHASLAVVQRALISLAGGLRALGHDADLESALSAAERAWHEEQARH